jgi:hypothetical protein
VPRKHPEREDEGLRVEKRRDEDAARSPRRPPAPCGSRATGQGRTGRDSIRRRASGPRRAPGSPARPDPPAPAARRCSKDSSRPRPGPARATDACLTGRPRRPGACWWGQASREGREPRGQRKGAHPCTAPSMTRASAP